MPSTQQDLHFAQLAKHHDRTNFDCGNLSLNQYLQKQANQDIRRRISRIFIATYLGQPEQVIGYYTLSSLALDLYSLPEELRRALPKHPLPAALIGRLAVDKHQHRRGIGKLLLADAIKRTLSVSEQIAIYALVVDAWDNQAKNFYLKFGFRSVQNDGDRLFLPLKQL